MHGVQRVYICHSFQNAVTALLDGYAPDDLKAVVKKRKKPKVVEAEREIVLPEKFKGEPRNLYAYLMSRAIPKETIKALLDAGLIYQDVRRNVIFLNYAKSCYELRGTYTYGVPYRQVGFTRSDRFWYFMNGENPTTVYITEAAIDAISLYELRNHEPAIYASMHGVANRKIIDRILAEEKYKVVLAVDNDDAGQACKNRYPDLPAITPNNKDWNEDLQSLR